MITPSYSLTATERVLPRLALDFTTALLDSRITFTRSGNTATVTNSSGIIVAINANLPRFDFDPTTLVCKGLLIEEARTNALLNSLIDGTSLATQSVTVTAAARTLSFYGTGTVVLSGAHSATVVGVGAYPTRTTLTFTPSAGVLTLTVTGTVQFAQLEAGAFATSYIPTEATAVTRNADVATMTGTNFSDWYNAVEGAVCVEYISAGSLASTPIVYAITDGVFANSMYLVTSNNTVFTIPSFAAVSSGAYVNYSTRNNCSAYKLNSIVSCSNAGSVGLDGTATIPTVNRLVLGAGWTAGGAFLNGHIKKFIFYKQRIINAEVQAFSK